MCVCVCVHVCVCGDGVRAAARMRKGKHLVVYVHMEEFRPYFLCAVEFFLASNFEFRSLRNFFPARVSSVDLFIEKHVRPISPFRHVLRLFDVSLHQFNDVDASSSNQLGGGGLGGGGGGSNNRPKKLSYQLSVFFGDDANRALRLCKRTGRRVFDGVKIEGVPQFIRSGGSSKKAEEVFELRAGRRTVVELVKDRISQVQFGFEIGDWESGQIIASGTVKFEEVSRQRKEYLASNPPPEEQFRCVRARSPTHRQARPERW
eukprot:GHVU01197021.1.p1 GENE.GHVU01197021.1~~GHVU01197021.1.p1  ORF type:complete len:261 (+),score=57.54 GHVU01197021.1:443-1225(+)